MIRREYEIKKIQKLDDVLETLWPTYNKAGSVIPEVSAERSEQDTIAIHSKLPSNEEVIKLCISLEEILFPNK